MAEVIANVLNDCGVHGMITFIDELDTVVRLERFVLLVRRMHCGTRVLHQILLFSHHHLAFAATSTL